jgi:S1-C subfamily serine protease
VAGLEPDDIIVSVDGQAPVTEQLLHESAARKAGGEQVRLSVLRDGQPREVVLTTGAAAEWPVPEQLESYLRQVIGD